MTLFLFVAPSGVKSWRVKYRFQGREKLLTLGTYPQLSLKEAREACADAKSASLALLCTIGAEKRVFFGLFNRRLIMPPNQSSISTYGFLRLPQILKIIPIGKSSWWEGCRTERFPKPVKLGPRTTVWRVEDIMALVERLGNSDEGKVAV
jgi:predicted DNA-binding transcriptional regulator AlpA